MRWEHNFLGIGSENTAGDLEFLVSGHYLPPNIPGATCDSSPRNDSPDQFCDCYYPGRNSGLGAAQVPGSSGLSQSPTYVCTPELMCNNLKRRLKRHVFDNPEHAFENSKP